MNSLIGQIKLPNKHQNTRFQYFDFISGLLLIQIIVMHILQFSENYYNVTFSMVMHVSFFFMPWFYFKSGYFFKTPDNIYNSIILYKAKKILIPFIVFSILGFLLVFPFELINGKPVDWKTFFSPGYSVIRHGDPGMCNLPIWFLLSLFFTFLGFSLLNKYKLKLLIITFPIVGYALFFFNIRLPFGLSILFLGVFFFYFGNIFKNNIEKSKSVKWFIVFSVVIYFITQIFFFSSLDFRINALTTGNYFIYILSALCGLILLFYFGVKVKMIKPINYIGENAIVYYVLHWPIILLIKNTFEYFSLRTTGYLYAIILTVSAFMILPVCVILLNKRLKFMIGR